MALITCSECGKEISDMAEACPHCGYKNEKTQTVSFDSETIRNEVKTANAESQKKLKITIGIIIASVLFIIILIAATSTNYGKYAGTYYSSMGGEGRYTNCPTTFVFNSDGSGRYYWKGFTVYFNYEVSGDGSVEMNAGDYLEYDGKFSGSTYVLDSPSLTYYKRD